jgi:sec-independent protein translocase protein TatB
MLNIGPPELLLIIVIALVVVGPQRLPDLGRTIGRGLREFRKVQDEVRDMVDTGMGDDFKQTTAELRKTAAELRGATDVTSAFRNTPHKARQRAAEAVRAATTPDDDEPAAEPASEAPQSPDPAPPTSASVAPEIEPSEEPSSNGSQPPPESEA